MKNNKFIYILFLALIISSCVDEILDKEPISGVTEAEYFDSPTEFRRATNTLYTALNTPRNPGTSEMLDHGSDLHANFLADSYGRGIVSFPITDSQWSSPYSTIRQANIILEKADEYEGNATEIAEYVAAAKFFRATQYFELLQRYGGVPITLEVLDLTSENVFAARSSRYEVVDVILEDLTDAIPNLPTQNNLLSEDYGKITTEAAKAYKAWVLLYAATWEKYVGTTTDGDGTSTGAGSAGAKDNQTAYLTEAISLNREVISSGAFELWNYNSEPDMRNRSNYYLFNIEGSASNPLGLDKTSNKEFIMYKVFDELLGTINTSQNSVGRVAPSRKMMDLFLATDGLPIAQSGSFAGYESPQDEYQNRDYRMECYFRNINTNEIPVDGELTLEGVIDNTGGTAYRNNKFVSTGYLQDIENPTDGHNWPIIRLATVYLNLAESLYELNSSITDAELNETINLTKARAGLPALTNAFASTNSLDILDEIRRERAVELFAENSRFHDLKRWGIAEDTLNKSILGPVVEGTDYEGNTNLYNSAAYPNGEEEVTTGKGILKAVVLDASTSRNFSRTTYLRPIPSQEIVQNSNILQNPGY
ncbi:RagB/SusD family nutrient uptake outer membrane protein [Polaribacter sp. Hel1_85]|uniref:RagB/SusD family nutrient uptake outer membrane protein n=1 Tax=Polaribacter sp. Hel1_85 TaxID=1250005 RepID=UPI00052D6797|nr:RagB/SusD family nutrient uptake outer membrane protein [Polaribacter sp. Hel1_85]KGL62285.1 SusD/RagB family lipoprotein [Polaribacter sp. Hel1_85]